MNEEMFLGLHTILICVAPRQRRIVERCLRDIWQ
jgi:hypothetical protein